MYAHHGAERPAQRPTPCVHRECRHPSRSTWSGARSLCCRSRAGARMGERLQSCADAERASRPSGASFLRRIGLCARSTGRLCRETAKRRLSVGAAILANTFSLPLPRFAGEGTLTSGMAGISVKRRVGLPLPLSRGRVGVGVYAAIASFASLLIRSTIDRRPLARCGVRCSARPSSLKSGCASASTISRAGRPE